MDETEAARQYYVLISDLRVEKRTAAFDMLSQDGNADVASLARIGKKVLDVIIGIAPASELDRVLHEFDSFSPTSYWSRFMETTGQELIRACYAITEMDEPERGEIVSHALRFMSRAQDGGFPLSDYSLGLLKKVKDGGGDNSRMAGDLMARNEMFTPEKSRVIKPPKRTGPKPKGGSRLKGVA